MVLESWFWIHGSGFMVLDLWFWIHGCGFMVLDSWFWIHGSGVMVLDSCRGHGLELAIQGVGSKVQGSGLISGGLRAWGEGNSV
jgi:hypothetical protein